MNIAWVLLLWLAILVLIAGALRWRGLRTAARRMFDQQRRLHSARRTYTTTNGATFTELDQVFYLQTQRWLEGQGFRLLGDLEDRQARAITGAPRSFARILLSPDGTTVAGIAHVRTWIRRRGGLFVRRALEHARLLAFATHLSDARAITTGILNAAAALEVPAWVERTFLAPGTPPDEVLACHQTRLSAALAHIPGLAPIAFHDLRELLERSYNEQDRIAAFRHDIGYLTDAELDRLTARGLSPWAARVMKAELRRLRALHRSEDHQRSAPHA